MILVVVSVVEVVEVVVVVLENEYKKMRSIHVGNVKFPLYQE